MQADIARAIRAAKQAGLTIVRIVARPDGVSLETEAAPPPVSPPPADPPRKIVL
jgi:hypothetical protein